MSTTATILHVAVANATLHQESSNLSLWVEQGQCGPAGLMSSRRVTTDQSADIDQRYGVTRESTIDGL